MTFQISILFTNGRIIRKVMGGGGGGGGGDKKKQKKKKILARENVCKKINAKKIPKKKIHTLDELH